MRALRSIIFTVLACWPSAAVVPQSDQWSEWSLVSSFQGVKYRWRSYPVSNGFRHCALQFRSTLPVRHTVVFVADYLDQHGRKHTFSRQGDNSKGAGFIVTMNDQGQLGFDHFDIMGGLCSEVIGIRVLPSQKNR